MIGRLVWLGCGMMIGGALVAAYLGMTERLPSVSSFAGTVVSLVVGCIIGVVGTLMSGISEAIGDYLTDRRKAFERKNAEQQLAGQLRAQMPELLAEMTTDLLNNPLIREFRICSERLNLSGKGVYLLYDPDKHPQLREKVGILEQLGYVTDITTDPHIPKYRMKPCFVEMLTKAGGASGIAAT